MRKRLNRIVKAASVTAFAFALCASDLSVQTALAGQNVPYETYTYDYYEDIKYTPAAYIPDGALTGAKIGCGDFLSPQDLNTDEEGNVYIADTGNSRVVMLDSSMTW